MSRCTRCSWLLDKSWEIIINFECWYKNSREAHNNANIRFVSLLLRHHFHFHLLIVRGPSCLSFFVTSCQTHTHTAKRTGDSCSKHLLIRKKTPSCIGLACQHPLLLLHHRITTVALNKARQWLLPVAPDSLHWKSMSPLVSCWLVRFTTDLTFYQWPDCEMIQLRNCMGLAKFVLSLWSCMNV